MGGPPEGGRGAQTWPTPAEATEQANGGGNTAFSRGLDSGLAKTAPRAEGLTQKSYRSYRRRLMLFSKQCQRRGRETEVEGAFLATSLLCDAAWEATEQLDLEKIETATRPFEPLFQLLDSLYQYEDLVEVPNRCEEFFQEFSRNKGEEMQGYLIRHATMMKKMKEVKVEIPKLLAGWHLMTRAGIPKWTHVQIKALCGGDLEYEKVSSALMRMFGADHKPNPKDLMRIGKDDNFYGETADEEVLVEYEEEDYDWNDAYYDDDEAYYEDELEEDTVPSDLENAADQTKEAFVNYMEPRRRMKELALSRGFYPIVALAPEAMGSRGKGDGRKGTGKGKGKSGGKSKGKGKSYAMRRTPTTRRPMSGLRRSSTTSGSSSAVSGSNEMRSTLSGSTAAHGPRFKRYRLQSNGVKEVPEESVAMVEEEVVNIEECLYASGDVGKAIIDSGATRTIVGEDNWKAWLEEASKKGIDLEVTTKQVTRDFRFGDGGTARSHYEVDFMAGIRGQRVRVQAAVIAGKTPFLLARPTLESLEMKQNYGTGQVSVLGLPWFQPERGHKGHYLLDLLEYKTPEENYCMVSIDEEVLQAVDAEVQMVSDERHLEWGIEPTIDVECKVNFNEAETGDLEVDYNKIYHIVNELVNHSFKKRDLRFWEVYVDQGQLATHIAEMYEDVTVSTFSLPEWDFSVKATRQKFKKLLQTEKPHFVWMAPPCTKWSPMQRINVKNEMEAEQLKNVRDVEEQSHLSLVADSFEECKVNEAGAAMEHPDSAESWRTSTMEAMKGYFEAVVDRCRTGLVYMRDGEVLGKVRKRTRIRTLSLRLAMAMDLPCQCFPQQHVQMIGKSGALKEMQNYEKGFVKRAATAIYADMEDRWRKREAVQIMVAEEMEELDTNEAKKDDWHTAKSNTASAKRVVSKLHRQLGHPNNAKLVKALRDAKIDETVVAQAAQYRCDVCEAHRFKSLEKPAALSKASYFNEMIEMDTFHIRWGDTKHKILAVIDAYTRFEVNSIIQSESMEEEIEVLKKQWLSWAGHPKIIKTDSSGAHMSEFFQAWCDERQIRLILVPKEAHHQLGLVERLHAVRRHQLVLMKSEKPDLEIETAVLLACEQRNRLRSVHGASPVALVFGYTPAQAGIADEPHGVRPDGHPRQLEDTENRIMAAKAFYTANNSATIRRALLAKSRKEHTPLQVGDYAFYWRTSNDKLEPSRWRGPALVCAVEPRHADDGVLRTAVYWLAHGSSLVRAAPEHVRLEVSSERAARLESLPQTAARQPLQEQLVQALRPVRSPIRFLDLGPRGPPSDARGDGLGLQATSVDGEGAGPGDLDFTPVPSSSRPGEAPSKRKKVDKEARPWKRSAIKSCKNS